MHGFRKFLQILFYRFIFIWCYFSIKDVYMYTKHGKRVLYGWWMKLHAKWINVMADSGCIVYICNKIGK